MLLKPFSIFPVPILIQKAHANAEILNLPVLLTNAAQTLNAAAGSLTLSQTVNNGGYLLTVTDGGFNSAVNGAISGAGGLTKTGSGTLTLSKGVGQAAEDTITNLTAPSNGTIAQVLTDITNQNSDLATQIADQQAMLTRMQTSLENQYSAMEATLSQLQAAGQSINSLG